MSIAIRQPSAPPATTAGGPTSLAAQGNPQPVADGWLDAVSKIVPGEMIVAFIAALQVPGVGDDRTAHLTILIVFAAMAPLVLWLSARRANTTAHWLHYVVRTSAFVCFGLGSDRVLMDWLGKLHWIPGVGALLIAVLAALVLAPPGAQALPGRAARKRSERANDDALKSAGVQEPLPE